MKDDAYRLQRIVAVGDQLLEVIQRRGLTREALLRDVEMQWLVTTPLFNIGEQANCVSDQITQQYPDLPWASVAGLRHRLVHDYEGTNWALICDVLFGELQPFIDAVRAIVAERDFADSSAME